MTRTRCLLALALLLSAGSSSFAADRPGVVVLAAASLREAFEAAAPAFTARSGMKVTFSFGGSDTLAAQIEQGVPADVFASANDVQMQRVAAAKLLASAPRALARNHLVVVVPKRGSGAVARFADLAKPGVRVVLAAATVPVGRYSRTAFGDLDGRDGFPAGFAALVERNVVSNELDVKAVATKISLGEGDAGVVYATDVTPALARDVTTIAFPQAAAVEAIYPIAPLRDAPNAAGARAFIDFILSPTGQAYLKARGFSSPFG
ncbi:MAG: modA [Candidatus Eremiobacteraeota bacterium]|nr:modA [Candidatus Eremiobacteraeota bacterium]